MSEPTKSGTPEESGTSESTQNILDFGSALTHTPYGSVYCLSIIGQIEGHMAAANGTKTTKYEHVLPLLAKLEESDEVDGVLFLLNTVGGDVEAGLAIAELIAGMTKPTVSIVLGGSHSIGVPLAVAAQHSFAGSVCRYDHSSGTHERYRHCRAADIQLLSAASGTDCGFCVRAQSYFGPAVSGSDAQQGGYGRRCGQCHLR